MGAYRGHADNQPAEVAYFIDVTWITTTLTAAVTLATLLPMIRRDAWWVRAWEFPRVQILALALLALALSPFGSEAPVHRWVMAAVAAGCALLQSIRIVPFTPLWPRKESPKAKRGQSPSFGILVANILMTNRQSNDFLDLVKSADPDLLLVLEADRWWQNALDPLRASFPFALEEPRDDTYGIVLLSKHPFEETEIRTLVDPEVPSVRCSLEPAPGCILTFFGLHPKPPAPQEATETTERDAELLVVAQEVRSNDGPTVVCGDLNDVAWSHTTRLFRRISGLLDPRIGRGLLSTFPAARPWLRFPLDHLFHSSELALVAFRRLRIAGSDHLAIFARLQFESPRPREELQPADPTPSELDLADEKIHAGLELADEK